MSYLIYIPNDKTNEICLVDPELLSEYILSQDDVASIQNWINTIDTTISAILINARARGGVDNITRAELDSLYLRRDNPDNITEKDYVKLEEFIRNQLLGCNETDFDLAEA
jgi:hypothetical protein